MRYRNNMLEEEVKVLEMFMQDQELQFSTDLSKLKTVIESADKIIKVFRSNQFSYMPTVWLAFKVKAQLFDNFIATSKVTVMHTWSSYILPTPTEYSEGNLIESEWILREFLYSHDKENKKPKSDMITYILRHADVIIKAFKSKRIQHTNAVTYAFKAKAEIFDNYLVAGNIKEDSHGKKHIEYATAEYIIPETIAIHHAKNIIEENHNVSKMSTSTLYNEIQKQLSPLHEVLKKNPNMYYDTYELIKMIEGIINNTYTSPARSTIEKKITLIIYNTVMLKKMTLEDIDYDRVLKSYQWKNIIYRIHPVTRKNIKEAIENTNSLSSIYQKKTTWSEMLEWAYRIQTQNWRKTPKASTLDKYDWDWSNTHGNAVRYYEDWRQY